MEASEDDGVVEECGVEEGAVGGVERVRAGNAGSGDGAVEKSWEMGNRVSSSLKSVSPTAQPRICT